MRCFQGLSEMSGLTFWIIFVHLHMSTHMLVLYDFLLNIIDHCITLSPTFGVFCLSLVLGGQRAIPSQIWQQSQSRILLSQTLKMGNSLVLDAKVICNYGSLLCVKWKSCNMDWMIELSYFTHYESIWYDNIYTANRLLGLESAICRMFLQCRARLQQQHDFELFSILSAINHTPFAQRVFFRSFAKSNLRSMFLLINLPDWI